MSQRMVLIDDTNPNIQYSGPWFIAQNTQLNTGNHGPPFQSTLHGVNVNASLSFSFSGSQVIFLGTSITTNASGTQDPTWECFVDNHSIGWYTAAQGAQNVQNSWVFCANSQLQDGPHVLTANVTVLHQQTFWFDQIQYSPSSYVPVDESVLRVDSSDSAIQYSSGWGELKGIVNLTQTAGSTVTYEFSGVSLSWFGFVPSSFPLTPSSATYSIDGRTPVTFSVPALNAAGALPLYNQVLFDTGRLSAGHHKLVVTHQGNAEKAPLAFDYFVVQNATSPSATSTLTGVADTTSIISSSVPSSSSSNSTSSLGSNKSPPVRTIVGVVVGVTLLLLLLLLFYICRRKNRRAQGQSENSDPASDPSVMHPFSSLQSRNYASEIHSLTPQPFASKLSQRAEPTDVRRITPNNMRSTSPPADGPISGSGGRMSALIPSRNQPLVPITSPLSSLAVTRINLIDPATRHTEMTPSMQVSASAQDGDPNFLQLEDSGVRMPPAQGNLVELPPAYTTR